MSALTDKEKFTFTSYFRGLHGKSVGEVIQSEFHTYNNAKWAVKLFPAGETVLSSTYMSILLIRCGFCREKVSVSFKIVCRDDPNSSIPVGPDVNIFDVDDVLGWGWPEAALQSTVFDETLGYLVDDELVIETTIELQSGKHSLLSDIRSLLFNEQSSDVIVKVDEESFPVHKLILSSRSPVFKAMLNSNMLESRTHEIIIVDFSADIVKEFLSFLYTDQCNIDLLDQIAEDLMRIANKYEVPFLQSFCEKHIASKMTASTCFEKLLFAHTYHYHLLKAEALKYIVNSGNSVVSVCTDEMMAELGMQLVTDLVRAFAAKPAPPAY